VRILAVAFAASFILACGSKPSPKAAQPVELASLISDDAVGVVRQPGKDFPVVLYTHELVVDNGEIPPCWAKLEHAITAGYQISLPVSSYFILEGELAKAEVEACVPSATRGMVKGDGGRDVVAFEGPAGTVYAAWRGRYVVLGNREQVDHATQAHAPDAVAHWRGVLSTPGAATTWVLRTDDAFADLLGAPTTSYLLVIDKLEPPPASFLSGRFVVHYASAQDVATGERHLKDWIARGQFPRRIAGPAEAVALFDRLAAALQRARITLDGTVLTLSFDSTMFGDMWPQFAAAIASLPAR
jgi:hypothetical protein